MTRKPEIDGYHKFISMICGRLILFSVLYLALLFLFLSAVSVPLLTFEEN